MVKLCACFHMLNATELYNPRSNKVSISKIYLTKKNDVVSRLWLKTFMKILDEIIKRICNFDVGCE